jgi:uncharacterized protein YlxP (DUF503 family)
MVIGILQVELMIGDAASLKDKRRVVNSLKDRLHREHQVAVAEVDKQDLHQLAVLGIAAVSNSVPHVQGLLDRIVDRMRSNGRFVVNDHHVEILTGR